ncbi:two-partner secretion domain-containing protein [Pasteurella multocida]|uniref:two-partner secretion domain-containing protein n=1 Tax=Pasteurella multocida TaxID=747 RepID=UPI00397A268C
MNKKCFRVIFSKTLQRLVVTSELAKAEGKSNEVSGPLSLPLSQLFARIRPLTFSLFCALGFVTFSHPALAETLIIQADKSAPKSQQPIILQTANGLPQVNIQTPNDKGLSHNKYSKFDVDTKGAILNNSRTNTQTQQAGWVQGNPYLARGEAKVILNEVNSNDPSVLKGYVEVAGKKADVIIANPSGIHCQGCGVINSDRATFTTGKPQIKNGNLDSFVVAKGKVKVDGKGLDNSRVDYTEILAREVQANAGMWSKKETKVVTGKNTIKRTDSPKDVQIVHTNQPVEEETKPQFAVDVGELGGMYSGKIHLIGTENGVGVRNAGHIGASAETLKIDSQGRIVNTGTLNANKTLDLTAVKGIENKGKVENKQGDITLKTTADIQQDGSVVARGGNIHKKADKIITQQGETVAKDNVRYQAPNIKAGQRSLIVAGVNIQDTDKGEVRELESQSAQGKSVQITATENVTLQGKHIASGNFTVNAESANLNHSQNSAHNIAVKADTGNIVADSAIFTAQEKLKLSTPKTLSTQSSHLTAKTIETEQQSLNAKSAVWKQTGEGEFRLKGDTVNTAGGTFATQGNLVVDSKHLENVEGTLSSEKSLTLNISGNITSTNGQLVAAENVDITSNHLINDRGFIYAKQNVTIHNQGKVSNQQTKGENKGIIAGQTLRLNSQDINNTAGKIGSQDVTLNAQSLLNNQGTVRTESHLNLNVSQIENHDGIISAAQQARLAIATLEQNNGQIDAHHLQLNATNLSSTGDSLIFANTLNLATRNLDNHDSRIVAKESANIATHGLLNNTNGTLGSQTGDLAINTHENRIENTKGKIVAAQALNIQSGAVTNSQGIISAKSVVLDTHNQALNNQNTFSIAGDKGIIAETSLQLNAKDIHNNQGNIHSNHSLNLSATSLVNQQGDVFARQHSNITTSTIQNDDLGKIRAGGQLELKTDSLSQISGQIGATVLNLIATQVDSTQNSTISGQTVSLSTDSLNNNGSRIIAQNNVDINAKTGIQNHRGTLASIDGNLSVDTHQSELNSSTGTISAQQGQLNLQTGKLNNQSGQIRAKQAAINTHQKTLINHDTLDKEYLLGIVVEEDLDLQAQLVDNQSGRVNVKNNATLVTQSLNNQAGEVLVKNTATINATQVDNQLGTIASTKGTLELTTTSLLNNQQGNLIAAKQLSLDTLGLNNQEGNVTSQGNLTLNTHQQQVNNQHGNITAQNQAELDTGLIHNQQGLIRADKKLTIDTHNQSLDNRHTQEKNKGIVGLGHIVLKGVSALLNQQGTLYAQGNLTIPVQTTAENQGGLIQSQETLTLSATSVNNQEGVITGKTNTITAKHIDNRAVSGEGSLISGESLILNVDKLDNQDTKAKGIKPEQGLQATHITLNTDTLNNQKGGIYSQNTANMTVNSHLDNQQGELLSANTLDIGHRGNLMVNNQEGLIQGKHRIGLTAKGLESEGAIKTEGDLTVSLKDSFTLNKAFEVGNDLTFKTEGNFENNAVQTVKNKATFTANRITNNANGEISANETTLNSTELTNRGVIDGGKTRINSSYVKNIGTGRIYGDHLAFKSETINNLAETVNGETKAGTIAAREKLDFGVGTLTNRDHALILSLGDLSIGGDLGNDGHSIGKAKLVDNGSATIESLNDGNINTVKLLNQNLELLLGEDSKTESIVEYATNQDSEKYSTKEGYIDFPHRAKHKNAYFHFFDKSKEKIVSENWYQWKYTRTTNTTTLLKTDPAKIIIGGNLHLQGDDLKNKDSHLNIGKSLWLGDEKFTSNPQKNNLGNTIILENIETQGEIHTKDDGTLLLYAPRSRKTKSSGKSKRRWYHDRPKLISDKLPEIPVNYFSFNLLDNAIGQPLIINSSIDSKKSAKDISLEKIEINSKEHKGNIDAQQLTDLNIQGSEKTHIVLTPALDDKDKKQIVNSGQVIGKLDTTIDNFDGKDLGNLKLPTIKTHLADVHLPQASLYRINPDHPRGYLVETDPKFTQRREWLSSDYMFDQLRYDHNRTHKRLGDGFYEQRLINEQINQLTGRRFIEGYQNDLEQYKALMNSGVKYAKQFNLTVGVGLTAQQMSELTTDMVWLVNKEVTLPNGQKVTVLTPQVYLVARNSDITSRGAVISANEIVGNVDKLENSGVIAGRDLTRIHSNQLENQGTILGDTVDLSAKQNLINLGGRIEAANSLSLQAGKKLEIASTLSHSKSADGNFERTILDQIGIVKVTGANGRLNLKSDGELTIKGAVVGSEGTLRADAKDILITTLNINNKEHYNGDSNNYYRLDQKSEVGSQLAGKNGVTLVAEKDAHLRQASISSADGNVTIASRKGNVNIEAGRAEEQLATSSKSTSKGLFSKTTETHRHEHNTTSAIGSEVDGKNINIISTQGNVTIKGSTTVAEQDLTLFGNKGVAIVSDVNTHYQKDESEKSKKGLMGSGGGIGFTVGKKKETIEADNTKESAARSQVGSLTGNTTIITKGHYQQTGSVVTSRDGDVDIQAKTANIEAARSDYESNYKRTFEQKGVTVAVNIPVVQAAQSVVSAVNSAKAVGTSKNDRINALGAVNAGFEAWRAGQQVGQLANALGQNPTQALSQDVSVSITYGEQKNVETQHSRGNTAEKSAINAGGKVTIRTEGAGKDSDITIAGSDVAGKKGTKLSAEGDVNIVAVDENHLERSTNKSQGFNAGVAISYGSSGFAFGVTAGGNVAKGYGNGESQAWVGSQVGSKESRTEIESGGDTNLIGSQALGKHVKVNAENLNIKSLQDTMKYEGKQESASAQVTVGYGASGSTSYNKSKMKADMASVNQQAGIFAGDEGYDIDVSKHTELTGGLVTSTTKAEAEGKNRFSTGTISSTNIKNHAEHKGSAISVSGSVAANFETPFADKGIAQSKKQEVNERGEEIYVAEGIENTNGFGEKKLATGLDSLTHTFSVGIGQDKDSQRSQTKSGINTSNLTIRDEKTQLEKTGKTVSEVKLELKTDTTLETAEANSGKLESRFDKEKVLKELNIQVKATKEFRQNAFSTIDAYVLPKQAELRQKVKEAKTEEEKKELYKEIYKLQYQKRLLETTVGIIAGSPDMAITQGTLQLAATKMREETLRNSRLFQGIKDEKTGEILRNDSYGSGYFDGVKLGGVRIDLDVICNSGMGTCTNNSDGTVSFIGNGNKKLSDAIDPTQNKKAAALYGETGGFQSVEGEWNLHFTRIPYSIGSLSDQVVESFAGTHDMIGGQMWGWYDKQGNTLQNKNVAQHIGSTATTVIAIPVAAPFAVSDAISSDFMEVLFKLGGN